MKGPPTLSATSARELFRLWDEVQSYYNPGREARFEVMFDLLEARLPASFRALELGPGPGSLCYRLLRRFPRATCVAVDHSAYLPLIGQRAIPRREASRLTWVRADLTDLSWTRELPAGKFDAVVSTTTLHWLAPGELASVLRACRDRLRPGGLLIEGDWVPLPRDDPQMARLLDGAIERSMDRYRAPNRSPTWEKFWRRMGREPALAEAQKVVRTAHRGRPRGGYNHSEERMLRLLRRSGFRSAAAVWRMYNTAILVGLR